MNILFIGDIYGRPGRDTVTKLLKDLREKENIDFVIANGENMRHGKGLSHQNIEDMTAAGVNFFTSGNHVWKEKQIVPFLDDKKLPIVRPANYPDNVPGRGYEIIQTEMGKRILVINLIGRVYVGFGFDCPFRKADQILSEVSGEKLDAIFVDFHAEATSEKAALANYLDGRVSAVIGTHTHVQTNDARILSGGTAFLTDVGFTGPEDSIIGAEKKLVIDHFLTQMPLKIEVAGGPTVFNAVKIEIDDDTSKATSINLITEHVE
ncbi:TIGR00282 family metallophosphoesterase [Pseudomonadota bacterium]